MYTKRIIPCLDVNNNRVVKGINFVNLKDAGDPVAVRMSLYFWILQLLLMQEKPLSIW